MIEDYERALKLGKKEYQRQVSRGSYPYLPAMEDVIGTTPIVREESVGLCGIPIDLIVGTAYAGRTNSFASNFMPLLDAESEFAKKWTTLSKAHVEEGIHDAIKVYEYMNHFYVVEGNKRVSVLRYYGAASVLATVVRKIPKRTEEPQNIIYYEFMDFYTITRIYRIIFSKVGSYQKLLSLVPVDSSKKWDDEFRQDFLSVYYRFESALKKSEARDLDLTTADMFLVVLENYGFEALDNLSTDEMVGRIHESIDEIKIEEIHDVQVAMAPEEPSHKNFVEKLFKNGPSNVKCAFVYNKGVQDSGWVYGHELGRLHLENVYAGRVTTEKFEISTTNMDMDSEEAIEEMTSSMEEIVSQGYQVIFATTRELIEPCLRVALAHPDVIVLNCSLNMPHKYVRTYYGRMYEAKFITGAIAAAMSEGDTIGYIADYPIYGMNANINAFALGASFVNPRAKIQLEWVTLKNPVEHSVRSRDDISVVSYRDMVAPNQRRKHDENDPALQFGLCIKENGRAINIAMPVWNWGAFYEKIVGIILNGDYHKYDDVALNYWWGMDAGVVDIFLSHRLPLGTKRMAEFLQTSIKNGSLRPFCGKLIRQDGTILSQDESCIAAEEVMTMNYLVDNVIGSIPSIEELREDAQPIVKLQSIL